MFVLGDLILTSAKILDWILDIYKWIVIVSALISWVRPDPYNPIVKFLSAVTEPVQRPIRKIIGYRLPLDISPIIVILGIIFIQSFLITTLMKIGYRLGGG